LLGYALLVQGYAAQAIPHLERAKEKSAVGIAQIQTGQLAEAVVNLQAALAEHPNDPDILYYLGRASGLLSKQSIDTLLAAYPDSARAHQAMAKTISYSATCQMLNGSIAKRCAYDQMCRKFTWNWVRCMPAPSNGPKRKKSFAHKRSCSG